MSTQPNNPTHGVTLEKMLNELLAHYGWDGLASRVDIRCFSHEPSIKSSLVFLRRTPWARAQVEALFVEMRARPADGRPRLFGKKGG
ncbi:VF530 family DNA-binding protein [Chromobacterium sp. CV08]|uniref:VF530 family protein n=1 Tax=Chromobacterium sp. CV08 TaxID=3133274 RepID=UPI003DA9B76A